MLLPLFVLRPLVVDREDRRLAAAVFSAMRRACCARNCANSSGVMRMVEAPLGTRVVDDNVLVRRWRRADTRNCANSSGVMTRVEAPLGTRVVAEYMCARRLLRDDAR